MKTYNLYFIIQLILCLIVQHLITAAISLMHLHIVPISKLKSISIYPFDCVLHRKSISILITKSMRYFEQKRYSSKKFKSDYNVKIIVIFRFMSIFIIFYSRWHLKWNFIAVIETSSYLFAYKTFSLSFNDFKRIVVEY